MDVILILILFLLATEAGVRRLKPEVNFSVYFNLLTSASAI